MKTTRILSRMVALVIFAAVPAAVSAQAPAPHVTATHPIKVSTCNPQRNTYMATGYTPAYYPGGPYWGWPTVYSGYSYYQYPVQGKPTLGIDYHNATTVTMKDIEFGLVAHGNLIAEVRDVGTFSPGAEIKHEFGLSPNVFPLGTAMVECVPLRITFVDGTKWKNPHLPQLNRSIYGKPH
ncbi:MAG: hypothetical protein JO029_14520 [Candidatus Eremiobacteraeota bacterium]|nr:hypothetical protein [Candidatus Eremiobacteraeota bacterium]MBV8435489.1 hypothetical protein [Candidatus Eremiobacteraeota bacterium]